jgi:hypothetical protein
MAAAVIAIGIADDSGKSAVKAITIPLAYLVIIGLSISTAPAVPRHDHRHRRRHLLKLASTADNIGSTYLAANGWNAYVNNGSAASAIIFPVALCAT